MALRVIVDGQPIPVSQFVTVQFDGVTGPVNGKATDQIHHVFKPSGTVDRNIWAANSNGVSNTSRKSHNSTTQQAIANSANTPN